MCEREGEVTVSPLHTFAAVDEYFAELRPSFEFLASVVRLQSFT